jgi:hypothetical protein
MTLRMFCNCCSKEYAVQREDIVLVEKLKPQSMRLEKSLYIYDEDCFFKELNKIKKLNNTKKEI